MSFEIERKFLVVSDAWRLSACDGEKLRDGLIGEFDGGKVRVRLGERKATLTVKGPRSGPLRAEFEYDIPHVDADAMLRTLCGNRCVEKTRYVVMHGGMRWTVDVYEGRLTGVVLAEVELDEENQTFEKPDWAGAEITDDPRFSKRALFRLFTEQGSARPLPELLANLT